MRKQFYKNAVLFTAENALRSKTIVIKQSSTTTKYLRRNRTEVINLPFARKRGNILPQAI